MKVIYILITLKCGSTRQAYFHHFQLTLLFQVKNVSTNVTFNALVCFECWDLIITYSER
jgi:hypothetical protein